MVHRESDDVPASDDSHAQEYRHEFNACKNLDQHLRNYFRRSDMTLETLETSILEAYDREQGDLQEVRAPLESPPSEAQPAVRLPVWPLGLALAACLAVAMAVHTFLPRAPLQWGEITISQIAARGGTPAATDAEAKTWCLSLMQSVDDAYKALSDPGESVLTSASAWSLDTHCKLQPGGAFSITVAAQSRLHPGDSANWTETFQNGEDFNARVREFGTLIAEQLAMDN